MTYRMLILAALAATSSTAALAQQQSPCAERNDVMSRLKDQYNEKPTGVGITDNGAVVELTTSDRGTWTLLVSFPNGRSCLMATGDGWEQAPAKAAGREIRFLR
ncbi:MAG: hypothetical protein IT562_20515 [Alphaproteobacteria bacterium]|nr:hypothetical protein [Alphaproteobacteria bacterium]